MSDLDVIRELEEILGIELEELKPDEFLIPYTDMVVNTMIPIEKKLKRFFDDSDVDKKIEQLFNIDIDNSTLEKRLRETFGTGNDTELEKEIFDTESLNKFYKGDFTRWLTSKLEVLQEEIGTYFEIQTEIEKMTELERYTLENSMGYQKDNLGKITGISIVRFLIPPKWQLPTDNLTTSETLDW